MMKALLTVKPQKARFPLLCLLALFSGAIVPLSMTPVSIWALGIIAMAGLSLSLNNQAPGQAAVIGWLFGVGMYGTGASWVYVSISTYSELGSLLSVLVTFLFICAMALFTALFAWILNRFLKPSVSARPLAFASLWFCSEWFRTWFLTGFPWLFLGYGHIHSPLSAFAPVFGVMGIGFVVALSGSALHMLIEKVTGSTKTTVKLIPTALPVACCWALALTLKLSGMSWVTPTGETASVAVVHGTVPQDDKFDPALNLEIVSRYADLTQPHWNRDIILWPETAIPMFHHQAGTVLEVLGSRASEAQNTLITGIFFRNEQREVHNSITSIGNGEGIYHKKRLVPVGEYVPLASVIGPVFQLFELPMSTIRPGPWKQPLLTAGSYNVAPFICYEVVYPDLVRQAAADADLLVTISNDTWFGDSWGPRQHMEMAAMRALENGRYLLRSTNNGFSGIVDAQGNILEVSTQFDPQVLTGEIQLYTGKTPYTRWGSWPVLLVSLLIFALVLKNRRT